MKPIESSYITLKELIVVIMAIAIGHIMIQSFNLLMNKDIVFLLLGFSLTLLSIRFLHGNVITLDLSVEMKSSDYTKSSMWRFLDFLTIIIQGSIFTVLGSTLDNNFYLWITLIFLLLSDLFLAIIGFTAFDSLSKERINWLFINIFSVIMLCAGKLFNLSFYYYLIGTLIIGSLLDYSLNWHFYFPRAEKDQKFS